MNKLQNDRLNYIIRDLTSKGYSELLGENFHKKNNPGYRALMHLAIDLEESLGFIPSEELCKKIERVGT